MVTARNSGSKPQVPPGLTVVFAYYENPGMLELQWREISRYSENLKDMIEIIVVDDGSRVSPASEVERPAQLPRHSIYRIAQDNPWNQDAARNIGAHEAAAPWLLLTDIDHVVPQVTLESLVHMQKDSSVFYTLGRVKFSGGEIGTNSEIRGSHPNSYVMTRKLYWDIGGHDEDYAGIYGKDFLFRKRALRKANEVHLEKLYLARVGSSTVRDAGTHSITRENTFRNRIWGYLLEFLKEVRLWRGVQALTYEYRKVL